MYLERVDAVLMYTLLGGVNECCQAQIMYSV